MERLPVILVLYLFGYILYSNFCSNLRVIEYLLEEDKDILFNWLSFGKSTVLNFASLYSNYKVNNNSNVNQFSNSQLNIILQVTKLLLNYLRAHPNIQLEQYIEKKNESGDTALLVACRKRGCANIELLVEAGADLKATDKEGNTAVILIASGQDKDLQMPKEDLSPFIYKVGLF